MPFETTKLLSEPLKLPRGPVLKNRLFLAPLTNMQSHTDGTLSSDEHRWLTMRAKGGFGLTMTCASSVSANGRGWPGQLGAFDDKHLAGLNRLSSDIKSEGSVSIVQIFHGGLRADTDVTGEGRVSASDHEKSGARALTLDEIEGLIEDFVAAAVRCEKAGFDGVELHGAHGYLICQFLSAQYNKRTDEYGGSFENRTRFLAEIIKRTRKACGPNFVLGLRLSAERFGLQMGEMLELTEGLMAGGQIDFMDMSLWDCFKEPEEEAYKGKSLIDHYAALNRHGVPLGVAGNLRHPSDVYRAMDSGVDFAIIGRGAIIHHDFANALLKDPTFEPRTLPVSPATLKEEGLSDSFIGYMATWKGFVSDA